VEETADALHRAATMPPAEQRERMASLRSTVREFNVYRWAGRMLADAGRWRLRARIEARVRRFQDDEPESAGRRHQPPPVLSPAGDAALAELLATSRCWPSTSTARWRPSCAARPTRARRRRWCSAWLALLALLPVAVVSGRALADLRPRLGFRPAHLVGNHGAEDEDDAAATARWTVALEPLRQRLQQQALLAAAGVTVEDKGRRSRCTTAWPATPPRRCGPSSCSCRVRGWTGRPGR
jgi:hypothetical protein